MRLEDYFDFLAADDIRLKDHRIGIESVLYEYIHRAQTPEEIAARFPTLSLEEIYATILYYLHNKEKVDAYIAAWIEHEDRMFAEQSRNLIATRIRLSKIKAEREAVKRQASEAEPQPTGGIKWQQGKVMKNYMPNYWKHAVPGNGRCFGPAVQLSSSDWLPSSPEKRLLIC